MWLFCRQGLKEVIKVKRGHKGGVLILYECYWELLRQESLSPTLTCTKKRSREHTARWRHLQTTRRNLSMKPTLSAPWSFQSPKLWEIYFCCLHHPVCGILWWRPQQTTRPPVLAVGGSDGNVVLKRSWLRWKESFLLSPPLSPSSCLMTLKALENGNHLLRMKEQEINALWTLMHQATTPTLSPLSPDCISREVNCLVLAIICFCHCCLYANKQTYF